MDELITNKDASVIQQAHDLMQNMRNAILAEKTPKEYQEEKPMGGNRSVTYVPASYMDNTFKKHIPFYEMSFPFQPFINLNWIIVGVQIKNKETGNTELGLKAHRLQIRKEKKDKIESGQMLLSELTPFDFIDVGNDVSACLTEAIKNAQSRFGIAADVYGKIIISAEELAETEEKFLSFLDTIKGDMTKKIIQDSWKTAKAANKPDLLNYLMEEYK